MIDSNRNFDPNIFSVFLGKSVKAPYRDGDQVKIARGELIEYSDGFLKIRGRLGTIVINERNLVRIIRDDID